jgi:hypothetical protein
MRARFRDGRQPEHWCNPMSSAPTMPTTGALPTGKLGGRLRTGGFAMREPEKKTCASIQAALRLDFAPTDQPPSSVLGSWVKIGQVRPDARSGWRGSDSGAP